MFMDKDRYSFWVFAVFFLLILFSVKFFSVTYTENTMNDKCKVDCANLSMVPYNNTGWGDEKIGCWCINLTDNSTHQQFMWFN